MTIKMTFLASLFIKCIHGDITRTEYTTGFHSLIYSTSVYSIESSWGVSIQHDIFTYVGMQDTLEDTKC